MSNFSLGAGIPPPRAARRKNPFRKADGQKEKRGVSEGNEFLPACSALKARWGWEAVRPRVSEEAKPAKIVSLIEKEFRARPLKDLSIFAGFAPPSGGEPRGGLARSARQLSQSEKGSREVYNYSNKHPVNDDTICGCLANGSFPSCLLSKNYDTIMLREFRIHDS